MCKPERAHVPVRALAALGAAAAVCLGVVWLVTATPFVAVAVAVVSVLCVAGISAAVWNVVRNRGLWRGESESLLLNALTWRPAKRVRPVRRPALPAAVPLAIEAPKPVLTLTGVVLESRETVR